MTYDGSKTVAAAGTRERLVDTNTPAVTVTLQGKASNTGAVYVGGTTVSATSGIALTPGVTVTFPAAGNADLYDLRDIWVDAATNGNVVLFTYSR